MSLPPGTYIIHNLSSGWVLDYGAHNFFHIYELHGHSNQLWYVRHSHGGSGYEIQGVRTREYLRADGKNLRCACRHGATVWNLERQFENIYSISISGTKVHMWCPNKETNKHLLLLSERDVGEGCFWKFEKIKDYVCEETDLLPLAPPPQNPLGSSSARSSTLVAQDLNIPDIDDAHFHTDMIFNMPRTPFTRNQRMVVLEWARRLGATNVPTMESFDEYERRMDGQSNNNISGNHAE